jgi:hypothetical protein
MNADKRRSNRGSLFLALLGSLFATPAISADFKSQLGDEIERRFEAASVDLDKSPIEFGCKFSEFTASRVKLRGNVPGVMYLMTSHHHDYHLEEPASLPQPTIVETYIAKGFPSGEREKGIKKTLRDDSYHLAERKVTFGGLEFSR